jgi:hypothetical protein
VTSEARLDRHDGHGDTRPRRPRLGGRANGLQRHDGSLPSAILGALPDSRMDDAAAVVNAN